MRSIAHPITRFAPYSVLLLLAVTVGCGGSPVPCDAEILVTKTNDTNDGLCSGADCSLREAVIRANACAGTQTIRIPAGTYTLTRAGAMEDAADTGDLDLTDHVTILGTSHPVIDGNGTDRVFDIQPGISASLSTLVIQNGHAEYDGGGGIRSRGTLNLNESTVQANDGDQPYLAAKLHDGGGILHESDGALGVYQSEIIGNTGFRGGGIAVMTWGLHAPTVMISYSTVSDNTAESEGGAVYLDSGVQATIIRFEGRGNSSGGDGGGIYNVGNLELTYAQLAENTAGFGGGGIYNAAEGSAIARMTSLVANESSHNGGGMYNLGMAHYYQSLFFHNVSTNGQGGGAYNGSGGSLLINNTTLSANVGIFGGGGIRNEGGNLQLMFVTLYANDSEGIHHSGIGKATMRNTILSSNPDGNCAGTPVDSFGYNIEAGDSCGLSETGDLPNTDPMLEPLAAGTSFLSTHALQPGSPAIDSADPDRCSGVDQRGVIRPQGAGCDRGAHENEAGGAGSGIISGVVWHDLCAVPEHGYPPTPPPGCSDPDGDGLHIDANGLLETGEPGLPGVLVRLKAGTCAAGVDLTTASTESEGEYSFNGLAAGTYCVTVNSLADGNIGVLIPGGWTYPDRGDSVVQTEVVLADGEARSDVNFGWDYQFLPGIPDYETPTPTPSPLSFLNPWVSTKELFYGGPNALPSCGPREAKFQIELSSLEGVANVNLFLRLKEQSSGKLGAWTSGIPMNPAGNNLYLATVPAEDIPDVKTFGESWVQYQFVALDKAGAAIARSEVFWNLTFARCEYRPKTQG